MRLPPARTIIVPYALPKARASAGSPFFPTVPRTSFHEGCIHRNNAGHCIFRPLSGLELINGYVKNIFHGMRVYMTHFVPETEAFCDFLTASYSFYRHTLVDENSSIFELLQLIENPIIT